MNLSQIHIPKRTRKDMGDLAALAASIQEVGILHLPVVNGAGELVCGERRLRAMESLGWTEIPVRVVKSLGEALLALKAERDENTCRKDFAPTEAVAMGERLEKFERKPGRPKGGKLPPLSTGGKTRDKVSAAVGMGARTYVKAKAIVEAAKTEPALRAIVEEMDRTGSVDKAHKKLKRHLQRQEHSRRVSDARRNPQAPATGPFDLILADPPWRYEHCEADNREIENQYPTASMPEIFSHVPPAKDDSILFLWATAPKLDEALQVMKAWGFSYRSCAVWDKEKMGMGYWWRIQHELLLVGVKGTPGATPEPARVASIFREARTGHSVKPASVYEWIERAFPDALKLEMYCRKPRQGWTHSGNEC